ncbi:MAG: hypothetical protein PWP60_459 [Candidatus Atribacteria bacterium]|nr:hypothetical protein [Candidatus Atribacteria bacterium]
MLIDLSSSVEAINGGLFVSRGIGQHPDRVIDSYELIFVTSGRLGIEEEGRSFILNPNHYLVLWPQKRHRGILPFEPDLRFYWIHFRVTSKEKLLHLSKNHSFFIHKQGRIKHPEPLIELFHRFLTLQETEKSFSISKNLVLLLIFCEIFKQYESSLIMGQHGEKISSSNGILAKWVEQYVRLRFREPISTSTIAKELGYNPDYLERKYKEAYGKTITQFIREYRLRRACRLLLESNLTIKEIAFASGFKDVNYFRKLFKQEKGITPTSYRKLYGKIHVNTA